MRAGRILVIAAAGDIRSAVASELRAAGHDVLGRADGTHLEHDLARFCPDVIVLDPELPGRDGYPLLETVRKRSAADVVTLTAQDARDPAGPATRAEAVLRRIERAPTRITVADMTIDTAAGTVRRGETRIALTATEFKLLTYLAVHSDRVVTKNRILTGVWGYDNYDPNLVEVNVSALRRKLERHGPRLLHTVRGLGYILRTDM